MKIKLIIAASAVSAAVLLSACVTTSKKAAMNSASKADMPATMMDDGMTKDDMMKDDTMKKDMSKDNMMKDDTMKKDMSKDNMMKDDMMKKDMSKDNMMKDDTMKKDMSKDNMMKDDMMMGDFVLESGTVAAGDGLGTRLRINSKGMHKELVLNIQEKTPTIDVMTGASVKKATVKAGVPVYAWVSSAYTASMPPQTAAQVLFVNVHDKEAIPALVEIAEITTTGDTVSLTATNGSKWMFNKNVEIGMHPVAAKGKTDTAALKKGLKVLLWKTNKMMKEKMYEAGKILIIS